MSHEHISCLEREKHGGAEAETVQNMSKHKARCREYFLVPASSSSGAPFGTITTLPIEAAEKIMGFPAGYTDLISEGVTTQSKYKRRNVLGNSFQVDTISALLSPLKDAQDRGDIGPLNVLSLFDGIGGAAAALVKAGIQVNKIITNEIDKRAAAIAKRFICSKGIQHVHFKDNIVIQSARISTYLTERATKGELVHLVIAGSPCNDLTRHQNMNASHTSRASKAKGFAGDDSHLFFFVIHFVRLVTELHLKYG